MSQIGFFIVFIYWKDTKPDMLPLNEVVLEQNCDSATTTVLVWDDGITSDRKFFQE